MASVKGAPRTPFARPRDDSFSMYGALVRDSFPPELDNSSPVVLSCQISLNRRRTLDGEIEIFDAEKYFSGAMDGDVQQVPENVPRTPSKKEVKVSVRPKSSTSSMNSGTTSYSSRRRLLRHGHNCPLPHWQREAKNKTFLCAFPCSCARKNAMDVDKEALSDAKSSNLKKLPQYGERCGGEVHLVSGLRLKGAGHGLKQELPAFPSNLNSVAGRARATVGKEFKEEESVGRAIPKRAFGATLFEKGHMGCNQRRSLTMSPSGKVINNGGGGDKSRHGDDDDIRSESSSDLFEIESISTNSHPFFGYESSEASVEWSVATASVANLSIVSEFDDKSTSLHRTRRDSRSRTGLLLGCISEQAVDVTAGASKLPVRATSERRRPEWSGLDGSVTTKVAARYRAESCGVHLGSGHAGRVDAFGSGRSSWVYGGAPASITGNSQFQNGVLN